MKSKPTIYYPMLLLTVLALAATACSLGGLTGNQEAEQATTAPATEAPVATEPAGQAGKETQTLPIKAGACANNLMPLEVGNQWVYAHYDGLGTEGMAEGDPTPVPSSTWTWTVTEVDDDFATIEAGSNDLGVAAEYTVRCEDGAILTFPNFTMQLSLSGGGGGSVDINYDNQTGEYLPSIETLEANNWDHEWVTELLVSGSMVSEAFPGQSLDITFEQSPWLMNWNTTGAGDEAFEAIEVAAGSFDRALKVEQEADFNFEMTLEGMGGLAVNFTTDSDQWFVEGVGLVRTRSNSATFDMDNFDIPLPSDFDATSTMELKEFRQDVPVGQ